MTLPPVVQDDYYLPANLGTIGAFIYAIFYVLLEPVAGGLIAPVIVAGAAAANYFLATYGATTVNWWAGGVHVVSWLAQFVGHGRFEGRAPALLDNLVQAILLAPLFVWMEVLFAVGYRPELKARYHENIEREVAAFQKKQQGKQEKQEKQQE